MEDYMNLTFNEFLEAVKGSKTKYVEHNFIFTFPGLSKLDTIQVYNYLEQITKNFDPFMVKLILKSVNTYLNNMNNSFGYKEFFGVDAYELDQFIELISILEDKLENSESIKQTDKTNVPPKTFVDYLQNNQKDKLINLLHNLLDDAKPKDIAKFILVLKDLQYIHIPTPKTDLYYAMRSEFNEIGTNSALNIYLSDTLNNNNKFTDQEMEEAKKLIENGLRG